MEQVLLYLILMLLAGIVTAVFVRRGRPIVIVIVSILIYVPSYLVWAALQDLGIVSRFYASADLRDRVVAASWNTPWGISFIWTAIVAVHSHLCCFFIRRRSLAGRGVKDF
jgi:hypothetical protein